MSNPWLNFVERKDFSQDELAGLNLRYFPKAVMSAAKNQFKNIDDSSSATLIRLESQTLSPSDINSFSEFTVNTFYKVHTEHYPTSEIETFKEHQKLFFSRPYQALYHKAGDEIKAYLVVGLIENHPFFKENVWHIGYWGMADNITDKSVRQAIKYDWGTKLAALNTEYMVVGNIDYFNKPALVMASQFNMTINGYRLDPR